MLVNRDVRVGHAGLWLATDPPDEVASVRWHTDSGSGYLKSNRPLIPGSSTWLVVNAVRSEERAQVHDALLAGPLEELVDWAAKAEHAGNAWQASRHVLSLRWRDARLWSDEQ
jgi:hypothetical protein